MAKWIWINESEHKNDSYASFKDKFTTEAKHVTLKVACDSFFAAYLNGELVLFSNCADYPHYKLYDEVEIKNVNKGENELYIIVWYHGVSTQTYIHDAPGVWFDVTCNGESVVSSSEKTVGRLEHNFRADYCKLITHQLGFSFYYDNTVNNTDTYEPCASVNKIQPQKRPQKALVLDGRIPVTYTRYADRILVDFGREVAGYPDLEFESDGEQEILFAFGEHLEIGKVSREIDGRDFSFEFKARAGQNKFFCPLRRIACRYIEVYAPLPIKISYIGMQHVYYPVTEKKKHIEDDLLRRIYEVSVRTLRLCMHEHYEDCPWREQALYALDSRNQMLFGYHAFRETEYQRSNLLLINQGLRDDGLLPICFPAGRDIPIPFFSLAFILEVCEYAENTADRSIFDETKNTISKIIAAFESKKGSLGLIPTLPPPCWNFYEWSEGNDGNLSEIGKRPFVEDCDLILNAMYVWVVGKYNEMAGAAYDTEDVRQAIHTQLYDAEKGLYRISLNGNLYGQLGNSLAILAGLGDARLAQKVASCEGMTPATLSMKPFLYDSLLKFGDTYRDFIIQDIKRVYKSMLDYGATSFWETELGWSDFHNAGSLCHGWSAAPVYYLSIFGLATDE